MSRLAQRHQESGLTILAVNAWDEPRDKVTSFVKEHQLKQRILMDGRQVARRYGLKGVPVLYWIDRQGIVVDVELGFHGPASLERKTNRLRAAGRN